MLSRFMAGIFTYILFVLRLLTFLFNIIVYLIFYYFVMYTFKDFEGREKLKEWIKTFEGMAADETLSESQVRQMIFDLESAYNAFNRLLQHT